MLTPISVFPFIIMMQFIGQCSKNFSSVLKKSVRKSLSAILFNCSFYLLFLFGISLRFWFTLVTPDVIFTPSIYDAKFSADPVVILQNNQKSFQNCENGTSCINGENLVDEHIKGLFKEHLKGLRTYLVTGHGIKRNLELEINYYQHLYQSSNGTFFELTPQLSVHDYRQG